MKSLAFLLLLLCAAIPAAAQPAHVYEDVRDHLATDADVEAWYTMLINLDRNFDDICGDTFCEGDWSNIQSLRFRCSVETATGILGRCLWIFAASNEEVVTATGRFVVDTKTWRCRAPLAPRTTLRELLDALAGDEPLYATLPRSSRTIYDGLTDCL